MEICDVLGPDPPQQQRGLAGRGVYPPQQQQGLAGGGVWGVLIWPPPPGSEVRVPQPLRPQKMWLIMDASPSDTFQCYTGHSLNAYIYPDIAVIVSVYTFALVIRLHRS